MLTLSPSHWRDSSLLIIFALRCSPTFILSLASPSWSWGWWWAFLFRWCLCSQCWLFCVLFLWGTASFPFIFCAWALFLYFWLRLNWWEISCSECRFCSWRAGCRGDRIGRCCWGWWPWLGGWACPIKLYSWIAINDRKCEIIMRSSKYMKLCMFELRLFLDAPCFKKRSPSSIIITVN